MSRPTGPFLPRTPDELFYFELEAFLDTCRRRGVPNAMIRAALARAERASLAMDGLWPSGSKALTTPTVEGD